MTDGQLSGRVAFITGAARGQGRAHAVRLASAGASIVGLDVCAELPVPTKPATREDLAETVRLVEAAGGAMHAEVGDVRSLADLQRAVDAGRERFGRIDIVVANAGITGTGLLWELTEQEFQDMIDVDLVGVWRTLKVTVPVLIEQGTGGSIILTSSVAGLRGLPFCAHYVAAKHGVVGLCRTLANELGMYDIRVNSVHPAGVQTEMIAETSKFRDLIARFQDTLGPIFMNALPYEVVAPEDVAEVVLWLASDAVRYTTGAQIPIDLGAHSVDAVVTSASSSVGGERAAVHRQRHAGDVAGLVGREEEHGVGDVDGVDERDVEDLQGLEGVEAVVERRGVEVGPEQLVGPVVEHHRRLHAARAHDVHPDVVRRDLVGEGAGHADHAVLGRDVVAAVHQRLQPGRRAGDHDGAPFALFDQRGHRGLDRVPHARQRDVEHRLPLGRRQLDQGPGPADARVGRRRCRAGRARPPRRRRPR